MGAIKARNSFPEEKMQLDSCLKPNTGARLKQIIVTARIRRKKLLSGCQATQSGGKKSGSLNFNRAGKPIQRERAQQIAAHTTLYLT